jgi:hypothetical protein
VPRLCDLYPGICLPTEEKAGKTLSQGSRRMQISQNVSPSLRDAYLYYSYRGHKSMEPGDKELPQDMDTFPVSERILLSTYRASPLRDKTRGSLDLYYVFFLFLPRCPHTHMYINFSQIFFFFPPPPPQAAD